MHSPDTSKHTVVFCSLPLNGSELASSFREHESALKRELVVLREIARAVADTTNNVTDAASNMASAQEWYDGIATDLGVTVRLRIDDRWHEFALLDDSLGDQLPPLALAVDVVTQQLARLAQKLCVDQHSLGHRSLAHGIAPPSNFTKESRASLLVSAASQIESVYAQLSEEYQSLTYGNDSIFENLASPHQSAVSEYIVATQLMLGLRALVASVRTIICRQKDLLQSVRALEVRVEHLTHELSGAAMACTEGTRMLKQAEIQRCRLNGSIAVHVSSASEVLHRASNLIRFPPAPDAEKTVLLRVSDLQLALLTYKVSQREGVLHFIDECCRTYEQICRRAETQHDVSLIINEKTSASLPITAKNEYRPLVITPTCIQIQPACREQDILCIARLNHATNQPLSDQEELRKHLRIEADRGYAFVARIGNRVAASITFTITTEAVQITSMAVAPDLWGEGVGRHLLEYCLSRWLQSDKREVLASFSEFSRVDIGFLIKMGFEEVEDQTTGSSSHRMWRYQK